MSKRTRATNDFRAGAATILPVLIAVIPFGLLLGALAAQKGLTSVEVGLMSAFVFAGGAQFVAVDLWQEPTPIVFLTLTVLLVNLRHMLMGAALAPHLHGSAAYGRLFFLADEIWALSLQRALERPLTPAFYLGLALPLYLSWIAWTVLGSLGGTLLDDPARFGFDFAFTAIFLCLLAGLWRGSRDRAPWGASALAAVLAYLILPPPWYILAGALAGTLMGAMRRPDLP